ncbi:MAG TPA: hypothetical protein VGA93_03730 [Actinomycetota bacterium]
MTYVMHVRHLSDLSKGDAVLAQHPRLVRKASTGQDQATGPTRELMARGSFWLGLPLQGFAIGHLVDQPIQPVVPILLAGESVALFLLEVLQALDPASPSGSHGVTLPSEPPSLSQRRSPLGEARGPANVATTGSGSAPPIQTGTLVALDHRVGAGEDEP